MKALAARFGWFAVIAALFAARDMCAGGGHPPDPEPTDAPSDAPPDSASNRTDTPDRSALV